ncbi:hypothetical protein [Erythrobacter sp. THAF29]|uniref:hypothetical protein n=1 Tax=Erythrobacter sp. THAF29 TaxID=2587851 RepID=UPI001267E395|nr:hypothetical protein [Erythrobacter sp. THAF29]QFT76427.1 hypothetical protein FIU90_02610 [Erythrobacter sp. THAF29]
MTTHFTELAQRAAVDGVVTPEELLSLRRQGWGDGIITREEAEAIFAINNVLTERGDEWCNFMVEAIGEYVLNGTKPRLQCSRDEAEWLIAQVDHDGVVESFAELECLVRIVERAENVPEVLKNYVLEQVEREVMTGTGPTRCGGELAATHITSAECRILRRVIFASGGYGPAAVTRFDAELLFRIKDATLEDENAGEWGDLFVDGVSNFLRGFVLDNAQLSHERKAELVKFVETESKGHTAFLAAMLQSKAKIGERVQWAIEHMNGTDGPQNDYFADAAAGHEVTDFEQDWLDGQLAQDGQIDELEKRVIRRLAELDDA